MTNREMIQQLERDGKLSYEQWVSLFSSFTEEDRDFASQTARKITDGKFGRKIYIRGIIEFSNICRNDCLYCGIRKSNKNVQ